jgi:hypothetical protein
MPLHPAPDDILNHLVSSGVVLKDSPSATAKAGLPAALLESGYRLPNPHVGTRRQI